MCNKISHSESNSGKTINSFCWNLSRNEMILRAKLIFMRKFVCSNRTSTWFSFEKVSPFNCWHAGEWVVGEGWPGCTIRGLGGEKYNLKRSGVSIHLRWMCGTSGLIERSVDNWKQIPSINSNRMSSVEQILPIHSNCFIFRANRFSIGTLRHDATTH